MTVVSLTDAPRPNKRFLAKARTTTRVIEAARFAFTNTGYFPSGIRDIARRAGMSIGAVFATAPDKESLWVLAMGGPPPSLFLAEEVALIEAQRPDWVLSCPGANPALPQTAPKTLPQWLQACRSKWLSLPVAGWLHLC